LVLLEHRLTLRGKSVQFFLLLYHLDFSQAPPWLLRFRRRQKQPPRPGEVMFPEVTLAAGELVAQVGLAGPPGALEGQVHIEVMSLTELGAELQPGSFRALAPEDPGPFCSERELLGPLGSPQGRPRPSRSGHESSSVLRTFFQRSPDRELLQKIAVRFPSEWVRSAAREDRLLRSPEFVALPAHLSILRDQIRPTQWWTPEVARRVGLPEDGVVWHYHPVTFLRFLHDLWKADAASRQRVSAALDAQGPDQSITDGLVGDSGFVDDEDRLSQEDNNIGLQQIVEGWPDLAPLPPLPPPKGQL
jgi:hypothetical protein